MCIEISPRARVLCFSRNRVLGETRRLVLERQYDAVYVGSLEELAALASGAAFDAIVLCHTLTSKDREHCLQIANSLWPRAKIVSVEIEDWSRQSEFGKVVLGLAGPRALLHTVQQVLQPAVGGLGPS